MKNLLTGVILLFIMSSFTSFPPVEGNQPQCTCNKDSMVVVMRFERKVKPEHVALFKKSFDACKEIVLKEEPGCLDYSLFQSYNDSTLFCLTEAWVNKAAHNHHMELEHTIKHIKEVSGINDPSFKPAANYVYWICPEANK